MEKSDLKDKVGLSSLLELEEDVENKKREYNLAEWNYDRVSRLIAVLPTLRYRMETGDNFKNIRKVEEDTYDRYLSNIFEIEVKLVPTRYFTHEEGTYKPVEIPPSKVDSFVRGLKNDMKNKNRKYSIA